MKTNFYSNNWFHYRKVQRICSLWVKISFWSNWWNSIWLKITSLRLFWIVQKMNFWTLFLTHWRKKLLLRRRKNLSLNSKRKLCWKKKRNLKIFTISSNNMFYSHSILYLWKIFLANKIFYLFKTLIWNKKIKKSIIWNSFKHA